MLLITQICTQQPLNALDSSEQHIFAVFEVIIFDIPFDYLPIT